MPCESKIIDIGAKAPSQTITTARVTALLQRHKIEVRRETGGDRRHLLQGIKRMEEEEAEEIPNIAKKAPSTIRADCLPNINLRAEGEEE